MRTLEYDSKGNDITPLENIADGIIILKPCPFCGGEAIIHTIEPHTHAFATFMPDYPGGTFIECKNDGCGCAMGRGTEQEVIEVWNRRTEVEE